MSETVRTTHHDEHRTKITIFIDGKPYVTRDDDQEAGALLRLAGLDPQHYDLTKIVGKGQVKRYKDGHVIDLRDGDKFESVKHDSAVA